MWSKQWGGVRIISSVTSSEAGYVIKKTWSDRDWILIESSLVATMMPLQCDDVRKVIPRCEKNRWPLSKRRFLKAVKIWDSSVITVLRENLIRKWFTAGEWWNWKLKTSFVSHLKKTKKILDITEWMLSHIEKSEPPHFLFSKLCPGKKPFSFDDDLQYIYHNTEHFSKGF